MTYLFDHALKPCEEEKLGLSQKTFQHHGQKFKAVSGPSIDLPLPDWSAGGPKPCYLADGSPLKPQRLTDAV